MWSHPLLAIAATLVSLSIATKLGNPESPKTLDAQLLADSANLVQEPLDSKVLAFAASRQQSFLKRYDELLSVLEQGRTAQQRLKKTSNRTVIAICMSTTSRAQGSTSPAMFSVMLPSLKASLTGAPDDVELWVYINVDEGDPLFNAPGKKTSILEQANHILSGVTVPIKTVAVVTPRYLNFMHKPGPAFNFVLKAAYEDGADYLYRVNDDTQFDGPWIQSALSNLQRLVPANVGMTGPWCPEGKTSIMTHDLTHRTHLDIFGHYYPEVLTDWGLDDWISNVYGVTRSVKGPFRVHHLIYTHPQSYAVSPGWQAALDSALRSGRQKFDYWLRTHH
eukprot:TRINITY_DN93095_c0_g1_i1.p1 TRINITY_DN93095_c0_g1~~TRINITY_DN93095_c0_g1_i1.p1  ORF type:complete len:335 (+),score=36.88 TRINITY_DN93095_c0_g1_i1:94-1098(+)